MKKVFSIVVLVSLILTAMTFPVAADVDATTTATPTTPASTNSTTNSTTKVTTYAPAPVKTAVNTASMTSNNVYTVVGGDAFWKIAKSFNITIDELAKLNTQVTNINKIYVGDKLIVKAATVATTVSSTTTAPAPVVAAKKLYYGFGEAADYRDSHISLNITTASVIFDQDGKIVDLTWDVQEISPELFPAWHTTPEEGAALVASVNDKWQTKREKGFDYNMSGKQTNNGVATNLSGKEWFEQLDFYQSYFKGKTVAEVEAWVNKYTDTVNRRPYKLAYPDALTDADKIAISTFTADENAMLVDVTSSATMSLQDGHSHFMTALKEAYEARKEIK